LLPAPQEVFSEIERRDWLVAMGCCQQVSLRQEAYTRRANAENKNLLEAIQFLRSTPIFTKVAESDYPLLAATMRTKTYRYCELVVREGVPCKDLCIIKHGKAAVWTHEGVTPFSRWMRPGVKQKTGCRPEGTAWCESESIREKDGGGSSSRRFVGRPDLQLPPIGGGTSASFDQFEQEDRFATKRNAGSDIIRCQSGNSVGSSPPRRSASSNPPFRTEQVAQMSRAKLSEEMHAFADREQLGQKVGILRSRDYFGEQAFWNEVWDVTILAASQDLVCMVLDQDKVRELYAEGKVSIPRRNFVRASRQVEPDEVESEDEIENEAKEKSREKSKKERELVREALKSSHHLAVIFGPDEMRIEAFVDVAWKVELAKGEEIKDKSSGKCLCIVQEGTLNEEMDVGPSDFASPGPPAELVVLDSDVIVAFDSETDEEGTKSFEPKTSTRDEWCQEISSRQVKPGSCCGELVLLYGASNASVLRALEKSVVWLVDRFDYESAMMNVTQAAVRARMRVLEEVDIFAALLSDEKKAVARAMVQVDYKDGQVVVKEGDRENCFFVLFAGEVAVEQNGLEVTRLHGVAPHREAEGNYQGTFFGKSALFSSHAMSSFVATVRATSKDVSFLTLTREALIATIGPVEDILDGQKDPHRTSRRSSLSIQRLEEREEPTSSAHTPVSGHRRSFIQRLEVTSEGLNGAVNPPMSPRMSLSRVEFSAELSKDAGAYTSGRGDIERSIGLESHKSSGTGSKPLSCTTSSDSIKGSRNRLFSQVPSKTSKRRASLGSLLRSGPLPIQMQDLKLIAPIGKGAFGTVHLCEHKNTKNIYALKCVKKARIMEKNMKNQILNEKYILEMMSSNFIISIVKTFRTDAELYFLLEPCMGGNLYSVYWKHKLFGKEAHARYYSGSVICALEHMHERFVIYRDMKPENLLLDARGRLKVTDMGLAKFVVGTTFTVCGTPSFFAPEVVQRVGYTRAVDWWALGILVWEFFVGRAPFNARREGEALYMLMTEKVLAGINKPKFPWPEAIPLNAREFFQALLVYQPSERLPMKPDGTQSLRGLSFFHRFDWVRLQAGTLKPPFWPEHVDIKNPASFRMEEGLTVRELDTYVDDGTNWDKDF